jgi:hypothetical protein
MKLISISQLLDQTWELYTQHFPRFMRITCWLFIGSIFHLASLFLAPEGRELTFLATQGLLNAPQIIGLILSVVGMGGLFALIRLWAQMEVMQTTDALQKKTSATPKDIHKRTWKFAFPFLGISIVRGLIFIIPLAVIAPMYIFTILTFTAENYILWDTLEQLWGFFGSIAGLILLVLLGTWFWFSSFVLLIEGKTIGASLRQARALVRGRFFATLGRLLVPKMLFSFVVIVLQIILYVLLAVLLTNLPGLGNSLYNVIASIIGNLVFIGSLALTIPLFISADYLLYDSLRKNP